MLTDNELKKKIVEILEEGYTPVECGDGDWVQTYFPTNEDVADALIAAGIGDVKDLQAGYDDAAKDRLYWVDKYKEAEHRAEVEEKIAKEACEIVFCEEIDNEEWDEVIRNYKKTKEKYSDEFGITDEMLYDYLHEKAEKELQEEGNE